MINFNNQQTSLDLNGPILSFTLQPSSVTVCAGLAATFTGVATAIFPTQTPNNPATNTGFVTYRWYDQNGPLFDDPPGAGQGGLTISGAGTTVLTLYGNTRSRNIYLSADYVPSAYGVIGVAVTVGSARSTGNAVNEFFASNTVSLNVNPNISITTQPSDVSVAPSQNAQFSTLATATDGTPVSYQWFLNGVSLSDTTSGTTQQTVPVSAKINVTPLRTTAFLDNTKVIDFSQTLVYNQFVPRGEYTLTSDSNVLVRVIAVGGSGGRSGERDFAGGSGGISIGYLTMYAGTVYRLLVGGPGDHGSRGSYGGGTFLRQTGGNAKSRDGAYPGGGGGGGLTGLYFNHQYENLFLTSRISSNANSATIIIAGGGGGASNSAEGGAGGGLTGGDPSGTNGGTGGTQSAGGTGGTGIAFNGSAGSDGFILAVGGGVKPSGGDGVAGGGGGYYGGGGGGAHDVCCADGAGGGGSGYLNLSYLDSSYANTITNGVRGGGGGSQIPGQLSVPATGGSFQIELVSTTSSANIAVNGSTSPNLTLSSNSEGLNQVQCVVSHPTACNSPILSRTANFQVRSPRQFMNFESIVSSSSAILNSINLFGNTIVIGGEGGRWSGAEIFLPRNLISFYAPEREVRVRMELHGGSGSDSGSYLGGRGGFSVIQFTMKKNEEYVFAGLNATSPGIFLYRKSSLIASIGNGGDASSSGNGGNGGGIGIAGETGGGKGGGTGGISYAPGTLPSSGGIFGSLSSFKSTNGADSIAEAPLGGRALPCPRGNQTVSPCTDLGISKFLWGQSSPILNTAEIDRGFKQGYGIRDTPGRGISGGGNGGGGTTGGAGGSAGGGGGGSGYTDGSVTVGPSYLGRSAFRAATVIIFLAPVTPVTPVTPPICIPISISSVYGTGFQGIILYADGTRQTAPNQSTSFITAGKTSLSSVSFTNPNDVTSTYGVLFDNIIGYYRDILQRYPDAPGFDFWVQEFVSSLGGYTSFDVLRSAIVSAATTNGELTTLALKGGIVGVYDSCNKLI